MNPPNSPNQRSMYAAAGLCGAAILTVSLWGGMLNDRVILQPGFGSAMGPYGMPLTVALSSLGLVIACWKPKVVGGPQRWKFSIIFLLVWAACSVPLGRDRSASLNTFSILASAVALAFATARVCRRPETAWGVALAALTSAAVVGAMGLGEYVEHARDGDTAWRVFSTFAMPNFLSGYLVMAVPLGLGVFLAARGGLFASFAALAILLDLACLLLTGSRFALAALGIALLVFVILTVRAGALSGSSRTRALGLIALTALAAVIGIRPVLNRLTGGVSEAYSGQFRTLTWRGAFHMAASNPILGTGIGSFSTAYPKYAKVGFTEHAHNSYLQLAAETGFPGLAAFLVGMAGVVVISVRSIWFGQAGAHHATSPESSLPVPPSEPAGKKRRRERRSSLSSAPTQDPAQPSVQPFEPMLLLAGLSAAMFGAMARNLFDSDLYVGANAVFFASITGLAVSLNTMASASVADDSESALPRTSTLSHKVNRLGTVLLFVILTGWAGTTSLGRTAAIRAQTALLIDHDGAAALDAWQQAVTFDPANPDYLLSLAETTARTGNPDGAKQVFERATRLAPIGKTFYRYGKFLMEIGDAAGAARQFALSRNADPHHLPNLLALAEAYRAIGRGREAMVVYLDMAADYQTPRGRLRALPEQIQWEYAMAHFALAEDAIAGNRAAEAEPFFTTGCGIMKDFWTKRHDARNQVRPDVWTRVTQRYEWALEQWSKTLRSLGNDKDSQRIAADLEIYRRELGEENQRREEETRKAGE